MSIFLIRHAHAVDAGEDPLRPLSRRGVDQVRALAGFLQRTGAFEPTEFWHSPLARAQETAELLASRMKLDVAFTVLPELEPDEDPAAMARRIKATQASVAIVGHEPHLSALASLLVAGKAEPPRFVMKKGTVLALEGVGQHWMVRWQVHPDLIA